MEHISVIVPVYHGRKYIKNILAQLERCCEISDKYTLELVFVNDDPHERLERISSEKLTVKLVETDQNRGIHAARVRGLKNSTGSYILFLDQDDCISPDYFVSQLRHLGNADAVVCRLLHEGRQFYDTRMPFESVMNREFVISVRNPIISPGQVLILREKIPDIWKEAELQNNGADDWMLWICMMGSHKKFALNSDILFEHVVEGHNESINVKHMMDSEQEMYKVIAEKNFLSAGELEQLRKAVRVSEDTHIQLLSKFHKMFFVYDEWLKLQEQGIYIHDYLIRSGIENVAIYADSYIGKRLFQSLRKSGFEVKYFIDKNAAYLKEDIPVCLPDKQLPQADMIIISLVEEVQIIKTELAGISEAEIYGIAELLDDMKNFRPEDKSSFSKETSALAERKGK